MQNAYNKIMDKLKTNNVGSDIYKNLKILIDVSSIIIRILRK